LPFGDNKMFSNTTIKYLLKSGSVVYHNFLWYSVLVRQVDS